MRFVMFLEKEEIKKQVGQEKCWCGGFKKSKYFPENRKHLNINKANLLIK